MTMQRTSDDDAAHFAKKLTARKGELVVLLLEIGIEDHHLGEAQRQEVHGIEAGKPVEHTVAEAGLANE